MATYAELATKYSATITDRDHTIVTLQTALLDLYIWANTNDAGDKFGNETAPLEAARIALRRATHALTEAV